MRILHLTHHYPPSISGVSNVLAAISERLAQRGHEVHVISSRSRGTASHEVLNGVSIRRFDVTGNAVRGLRGEVREYVETVLNFPGDVVVIHCAQAWPLDALLPSLQRVKPAVVYVGHGLTLGDPMYDEYFNRLAQALRDVNRMVALSAILEEVPFWVQHGLDEPVIIPNGVDIAAFNSSRQNVRAKWGIGERPWLVSVSNHSPVKGHHRLFEVARRICEELPEATTTVIGDPYPAKKWRLGRLGVKGGCWYPCRLRAAVTPGVSLRWNVPRAGVVSAVQEADLVLITSTREASPLVVLESMAAGTPWVSFDVGCVREHVGGVVVHSSEEMASAAVSLLRDADARSKLGQQGQQRARQRHDWDVIAQSYEQVYAEAVASS